VGRIARVDGTDLFLTFQGYECGFPVLDCADIHVEAIYQEPLGSA
jgi:aspartate racemase